LADFRNTLRDAGVHVLQVARHFVADRGFQSAAALTYMTLLALVPTTAVGLSILRLLPSDPQDVDGIRGFIFGNFLPESAEVVWGYVVDFSERATALGTFGLLTLFITALATIATVDDTLNSIWRLRPRRKAASTLLVYWAILTLVPLLVASGVLLSLRVGAWAGASQWLGVVALLLTWGGFSFVYTIVPDTNVRAADAWSAGLLASVLFEALRYGFGAYVRWIPTYHSIYGAVAVFPLFLIWLWAAWLILLIGAEWAWALDARRSGSLGSKGERRGLDIRTVVDALGVVLDAQRRGRAIATIGVAHVLNVQISVADGALVALQKIGYLTQDPLQRWVVLVDVRTTTLGELVAGITGLDEGGDDIFSSYLSALAATVRGTGEVTLEKLLDSQLS